MTDNKEVQPMTLDDFDKCLANEENTPLNIPDDEWNEEYDSGFKDGLGRARSILRLHRTALEAGMRGTLRFKIFEVDTPEYGPVFELMFSHDDGEIVTVTVEDNDTLCTIGVPWEDREVVRQQGIDIAQSLGMTAEFVEDYE